MAGQTKFITQANWEEVLHIWYVLVDDSLASLLEQIGPIQRSGPEPRFSDSEVITVSVFINVYFGGHEAMGLSCVRQHYRHLFPHLPNPGVFNKRYRQLGQGIEAVRQQLLLQEHLLESTLDLPDVPERSGTRPWVPRIIDSAPIFLSTYTRGHECQSVVGADYVGYSSSRRAHFFGMRLVCLCTPNQQVHDWYLAPAADHDSKSAKEILERHTDMQVLGDGAYRKPDLQEHLADYHNIELLAPPRKGAKAAWSDEERHKHGKRRRIIESVFSTLARVYHFQQPGSRSFDGLIVRTCTSILAYTLGTVTQRYLDQLAA